MKILKAFYTIITSTLSIAFVLVMINPKVSSDIGVTGLIALSLLIFALLIQAWQGITMELAKS